jgi:adenosylhomocysteine nucleosidase
MFEAKGHKVVLIVALKAEARSLIRVAGLKRSNDHSWSCYESKVFDLVISGVGKENAEKTTILILERYRLPTICNLGVCGSRSKKYEIGTSIYVNSIYDSLSKRSYFPDPVVRHSFRESGLVTYDEPQDNNSVQLKKHFPLVDMEAAFVCSVLDKKIPWQRVHVMKVVSDHLDYKCLSASHIEDIMRDLSIDFIDFIYKISDHKLKEMHLDDVTLSKISKLFEFLNLSSTQRKKLHRLILCRYTTGDKDLPCLDFSIYPSKINKCSRNIIFSEICSEVLQ